jgi:hypothetical protein
MPTIFNSKDSIFFVGGRGTKAGDSNAGGGATLEAWKDSAKLNKDLSNVMGADGDVLSGDGAWSGGAGFGCIVAEGASGKIRITRAVTANFLDCKVGLVAYCYFPATYTTGRYEVLVVDPSGYYIDVDLTYTADGNCSVKVGGAFDTAQNNWSNTDATNGYSVTIHSNKSQSKTNGDFTATWNLGTASGSLTNKSFKRLVGFTTQPEDGGQITFDGEDNAAFSPNGGVCFDDVIECVIFENVTVENAYIGWKSSASSSVANIRFMNCQGNGGTGGGFWLTTGRSYVLIGCQANNNSLRGFYIVYASGYPNHLLINCIAHSNVREGFCDVGGRYGSVLLGCLAYNNGNGGTKYSGFMTNSFYGCGAVKNCVSYNNGKHGFEFKRGNPIAINCIAKDNGQYGFYADTSLPLMAPYVAYCCAHGNSSGQYSLPAALPGQSSIEQDPQFVNAANGDFRPCNPTVLRGGKPDISANPTQMGVVLQKYQFGDRERIANIARLRIIR